MNCNEPLSKCDRPKRMGFITDGNGCPIGRIWHCCGYKRMYGPDWKEHLALQDTPHTPECVWST